MGHNHRAAPPSLHALAWYDGLLVAAGVMLVALHAQLASRPVLFGVLAALLVGMAVHRLFAWMESTEAELEQSGPRPEMAYEQPRHSARPA